MRDVGGATLPCTLAANTAFDAQNAPGCDKRKSSAGKSAEVDIQLSQVFPTEASRHFLRADTTPTLLGLFPLVTITVDRHFAGGGLVVRRARWDEKRSPAFSAALGAVRRPLSGAQTLFTSRSGSEIVNISRGVLNRLTDSPAYAA